MMSGETIQWSVCFISLRTLQFAKVVACQLLHLINLFDELVRRRQIKLVLTCKDCLVVFWQRQPHSRIVFVRTQQYAYRRILVGLLLIPVVIIDVELQLP